MEEWLNSPAIIIAALAVLGTIFGIGRWVGNVNSDRTKFHDFMEEIRTDIKQILGRLQPTVVSSSSPLELTDLGKAISTKLNVREWVQQHAPALTEEIEDKQPYQIQEFCFTYVKRKFSKDDDDLRRIQACAYEHGIEQTQVLNVYAVELRNALLPMPASNTEEE